MHGMSNSMKAASPVAVLTTKRHAAALVNQRGSTHWSMYQHLIASAPHFFGAKIGW
jgi:hypothetical protein